MTTKNALVFQQAPPDGYWSGPSQFDFIAVNGEIIPNSGAVLENITRAGINGTAWRLRERHGEPFTLLTAAEEYAVIDAYNLQLYYRQAVGSLFTLYDGLGNIWYNALALDTRSPIPRKLAKSIGSGGGTSYLVECQWTLILAAAPS